MTSNPKWVCYSCGRELTDGGKPTDRCFYCLKWRYYPGSADAASDQASRAERQDAERSKGAGI